MGKADATEACKLQTGSLHCRCRKSFASCWSCINGRTVCLLCIGGLEFGIKMIAYGPKKDGSPNVKYFESSETLTSLEVVRQWLQKTARKVGWNTSNRFFWLVI